MTNEQIMAGAIGAIVAGGIGLLFWFAKQYFVRKDLRHDLIEDRVDAARMEIAGINAKLEHQTLTLERILKELAHIDRKLVKVFEFIDAPRRETDRAKQSTI